MKTVPATVTLEAAVARFPGEVSVSRGGFAQAVAGASPTANPTNSDVVTPAAATPLRIDPPHKCKRRAPSRKGRRNARGRSLAHRARIRALPPTCRDVGRFECSSVDVPGLRQNAAHDFRRV